MFLWWYTSRAPYTAHENVWIETMRFIRCGYTFNPDLFTEIESVMNTAYKVFVGRVNLVHNLIRGPHMRYEAYAALLNDRYNIVYQQTAFVVPTLGFVNDYFRDDLVVIINTLAEQRNFDFEWIEISANHTIQMAYGRNGHNGYQVRVLMFRSKIHYHTRLGVQSEIVLDTSEHVHDHLVERNYTFSDFEFEENVRSFLSTICAFLAGQ